MYNNINRRKKLLEKKPQLYQEWHSKKNKGQDIINISPITKVWWICEKGHEWKQSLTIRTRANCPYCAKHRRRASKDFNLKVNFPDIAKTWHPTKNKPLIPEQINPNSMKTAWWICEKNHEYKSRIKVRCLGSGCHYCTNRKIGYGNDFKSNFPELMKEWHPTKNKNIDPSKLFPVSGKSVWWLCFKGHEWKTRIGHRTKGAKTGCPICSTQTSRTEVYIFTELKYIFKNVENRKKINNNEVDIYIDDIKTCIEFDGSYWHKGREDKDISKNNLLKKEGYQIIRVREKPLKKLGNNDILVGINDQRQDIVNVLFKKISKKYPNHNKMITKYLKSGLQQNKDLYNTMLSYKPIPNKADSFMERFPEIAKEWHLEKNYPLLPSSFKPFSRKKVWWKCNKGHEWVQSIGHRSEGRKCPFCFGRKKY